MGFFTDLAFLVWPVEFLLCSGSVGTLLHYVGGCRVSPGSDGTLLITAEFLGCDKSELNAALVSRVMQTPMAGRRGSAIMCVVRLSVPLSVCLSDWSLWQHHSVCTILFAVGLTSAG